MSADGISGLPLDMRMHLWQERKKQKLMLIRREAQKMEEEEYRGVPISPRQRVQFLTERGIRCGPTVASGDATAPVRESHSSSGGGAAAAAARPVGHEETMLKALQALEHAERVSQYIMID
ncbi:hypothetical protein TRSC58_04204 [Trypanosoma rangeli SC58]|uniref:Uncharacterized protein n=1 Tax=Trypanosoma rangeli SC58 TaxID=429131 RepID=A0A061IZK3_TRYRA|nr:hypothetical protein TRSC58_04204 [Trypanosoma rangeli SC58]